MLILAVKYAEQESWSFFFRCNLISSGKSCGYDAQCSNAWDYFCMQAESGGTLWWDGL